MNNVKEFSKGTLGSSLFLFGCLVLTFGMAAISPLLFMLSQPICLVLAIWLLIRMAKRGVLNSYRIAGIVVGPIILFVLFMIIAKFTIFKNGLWS